MPPLHAAAAARVTHARARTSMCVCMRVHECVRPHRSKYILALPQWVEVCDKGQISECTRPSRVNLSFVQSFLVDRAISKR